MGSALADTGVAAWAGEGPPALDDVRSAGAVERLLEDSWASRSREASPRELAAEGLASALFLLVAGALALLATPARAFDPELAAVLVALYALTARLIKFPLGAGYVVPSYLVLVPMLLLLPPSVVPLLTAAGLLLGTLGELAAHRASPQRVLFSIADGWHSLGPALVLTAFAGAHSGAPVAAVYACAFLAGCLVDLGSSTLREAAALGVAPHVQARVIALVWLIDACLAPLGLLVAKAAQHHPANVLLLLPAIGLLWLLTRERSARIEQAQRRLDVLARERSRLQKAVRCLGDAFAARLDLGALAGILLQGSIEALDADAGRFTLAGAVDPVTLEAGDSAAGVRALQAAAAAADARDDWAQLCRDGVWALALPFAFLGQSGMARGAIAVARADRPFREDERAVLRGLADRARKAATDVIGHQLLREQALTDSLTGLGNRRQLIADAERWLDDATGSHPLALVLFDLNGFKSYNDTFGHSAGDALLARVGGKLAAVVAHRGAAYRLGGDEFCVLLSVPPQLVDGMIAEAAAALEERGEHFHVGASHGEALVPSDARALDGALQLADERMYSRKRGRSSVAAEQTRDVLLSVMQSQAPALTAHAEAVARVCLAVGRRLGMRGEELDELVRAAELRNVGKVGIPTAILQKSGALEQDEWDYTRRHAVLGARILSAAPALRPVAAIVRARHERWDGRGYPDALRGERIPLAARVIAACDAYGAMRSSRSYRASMSHDAACAELRAGSGRQFDPRVVAALLDELHAYEHVDSGGGSEALEGERSATGLQAPAPDRPARAVGSPPRR